MMSLLQDGMNWRITPNTMEENNLEIYLSPRDKNNFNLKLYLLPSSVGMSWHNGEIKYNSNFKANFVSKDELSGRINSCGTIAIWMLIYILLGTKIWELFNPFVLGRWGLCDSAVWHQRVVRGDSTSAVSVTAAVWIVMDMKRSLLHFFFNWKYTIWKTN